MNELYSNYIKKSVWVTIIAFVIRCAISWQSLIQSVSMYDLFGFAGEAIAFSAIVMTVYEKWLWKYNPFEDVPVLKKQYTGKFKSNYDDSIRRFDIEIKQTLLSVRVTMKTKESNSNSISANIVDVLGEKQLVYYYLNTPKMEFRNRSDVHYGTAIISVENTDIMRGRYYTDRMTCGDITFDKK